MKKATTTTQYIRRILLQIPVDAGALQGSNLSPDPISHPINGSSETPTIRGNPMQAMALTILVLLIVLCFISFFSIYICLFAEEDSTTDVRRQRHPSRLPGLRDNNQKSCGVDAAVIKSLPLVSYSWRAKQLITDCPICLSEFEEREIVKLIPRCSHVFHPECIDTWLSSHVSCPLCRSTQLFLFVDDDEVRLDASEEENGNGVNELGGRSMVDDMTR